MECPNCQQVMTTDEEKLWLLAWISRFILMLGFSTGCRPFVRPNTVSTHKVSLVNWGHFIYTLSQLLEMLLDLHAQGKQTLYRKRNVFQTVVLPSIYTKIKYKYISFNRRAFGLLGTSFSFFDFYQFRFRLLKSIPRPRRILGNSHTRDFSSRGLGGIWQFFSFLNFLNKFFFALVS